jgi:hypothetical protein
MAAYFPLLNSKIFSASFKAGIFLNHKLPAVLNSQLSINSKKKAVFADSFFTKYLILISVQYKPKCHIHLYSEEQQPPSSI